MENKDYILILEKSNSNLTAKKVGDDYTLEGIAAFFGKENENRRIYEEQEYLPHMDYRDWETDRKSTRLNSSHITRSRMPSSA